jgi:uncharacterized protein (TIGR01319 family)
VYPRIDDLNVEPARKIIQDAFEDHITDAPGMEHVRDMVNGPIIPTPGAVMECTKLLYECLGSVVTIDVGGATTDVHSVAEESEQISRILINPEPKAKRTVEGDLGVYVNMKNIVDIIGEEKLREEFSDIEIDKIMAEYQAIPQNGEEKRFVERLTKQAVLDSVERHAGKIRYIFGPSGRNTVAEGKDLTQVKYIIGTGGALTRLPNRVKILKEIAKSNETGLFLFPSEKAKILVDNDYIMASLGVLSKRYKEGTIRLLEKSLAIKFPKKHEPKKTKKTVYQIELDRLESQALQGQF